MSLLAAFAEPDGGRDRWFPLSVAESGGSALYWPGFLLSLLLVGLLLYGGIRYFRGTERTFTDTI